MSLDDASTVVCAALQQRPVYPSAKMDRPVYPLRGQTDDDAGWVAALRAAAAECGYTLHIARNASHRLYLTPWEGLSHEGRHNHKRSSRWPSG